MEVRSFVNPALKCREFFSFLKKEAGSSITEMALVVPLITSITLYSIFFTFNRKEFIN